VAVWRTVSHQGSLPVELHAVSGLRNVCGARSATLLFHAGHDRQRNINAGSTQRMLSAYNAKLRKYVLDNAPVLVPLHSR
jgi:hypothetical protein